MNVRFDSKSLRLRLNSEEFFILESEGTFSETLSFTSKETLKWNLTATSSEHAAFERTDSELNFSVPAAAVAELSRKWKENSGKKDLAVNFALPNLMVFLEIDYFAKKKGMDN